MEKYKIILIVGDNGKDGGCGHGMQEEIAFTSNKSLKDIKKAYRKGVRKCGVDLSKDVVTTENPCRYTTYAIQRLAIKQAEFLEDLGERFDFSSINFNSSLMKIDPLNPRQFCLLWVLIARFGDSDLIIEENEEYAERLYVGGYGLFSKA